MLASIAVVIDYQNIHLTGHDHFAPQGTPKHESLIHPLLFAEEVVKRREETLAPLRIAGTSNLPPNGELSQVIVFRGCPSNGGQRSALLLSFAREIVVPTHRFLYSMWSRVARWAFTGIVRASPAARISMIPRMPQ